MKILLILNGLGNEGVTTIALTYLYELLNSDIEFHIAVAGPCDEIKLNELLKKNVIVHKMPSRKTDTKKYSLALMKLIRTNKFDIVHIHGNSATMGIDLFIAMISGCKNRIAHCHNTKCDNEKVNKILKPLLFLTATERFACSIESGKWLYGNKRFEVIQNGRNTEKYLYSIRKRLEIRKQLKVKDTDILIGHVGTFTYQKNQERLIEILCEMKKELNRSFKLVLIGDGPLKSSVEKEVHEKGLNDSVIFTGNVNNVNDYLSAFDIMVLPSRFEGLPLVAIEWQANGLPCIFSDEVTKECKILENVRFISLDEDNDTWKRCMCELLKIGRVYDSEYIKLEMQKKGFDIKNNALHLKEIYNQMINK